MGTVLIRVPSTVLLKDAQALFEGQQASLGMHRQLEAALVPEINASGKIASERRDFIVIIAAKEWSERLIDWLQAAWVTGQDQRGI
jgi:hypothetical protein